MKRQTNSTGGTSATRALRLIRAGTENKFRLVVSCLAGEALTLSAFHHLWDLWSLSWDKQALAGLVVGPAIGFLVAIGLAPVWDCWASIRWTRWLLFAVPAACIAAVVTWRIFGVPEVEHVLTIEPVLGVRATDVRIREVRGPYGRIIPLTTFERLDGWSVQAGLLTAATSSAETIRYTFRGPIAEQVRISFITHPQSGGVKVNLDGRVLDLDLRGMEGNETRARLHTQYRWGALNFLIVPLLITADFLAILFLLGLIWTVSEMGQAQDSVSGNTPYVTLRSHLAGLFFVCALALVLHGVNFLAVPLRVTKDGPSYLQGAVHWMTYGNLDGASSYRGPGTTFLFGPVMRLFGRNPWGVKLILHLLAFACVPLAYRVGWQLQKQRWVAIAAGTLVALSPDLYAYSNFTLSEVPDIFALLAFLTLLISALGSLNLGWMLATLLAGCMAALIRSDNIVAFGLGIAALAIASVLPPKGNTKTEWVPATRRMRLRNVVIASISAIIPLVAWSAHNARTHGFFGISDYAGEVLYDGWIYYGESFGIRITDRDSAAVKALDEVAPIVARHGLGPPTGWTVYYRLLDHGYDSAQAFSLLGQAAADSIRRHAPEAMKLLVVKLRQAPRPDPVTPPSIASSSSADRNADRTAQYFDTEMGLQDSLGRVQDQVYALVHNWYAVLGTIWFGLSMMMLWLCFYRRPASIWLPVCVIIANVLVLPIVAGIASWRYLIPGTILLVPVTFAALDNLGRFALSCAGRTLRGPAVQSDIPVA